MIGVAFNGDEERVKSNQHVYQWDTGQKVMVSGLGNSAINKVHFSFKGLTTAYVVDTTNTSGTITVDVPDIVLRYGKDIYMYLCIKNTNGTVVTIKTVIIPVVKRNMPENYMYNDDETVEASIELFKTNADAITENNLSAIEAKGIQTLDSIPDDYTNLQTQIDANTQGLNDIAIPSLIDINSRVIGKFIRYDNGKEYSQSSYSYVYCNVKPNTKYELLGDNGFTQIVFFNGDTYINGISQCPRTFETPEGTTRIAISFSNAYADTIVCRELEPPTSKSLIKNSALDMEYITDYVNGDTSGIVKTVDISGGGDFTTIADAIAYAGTQTSKVIIKVKNGVYEELMIDFKGNFELIGESRTGVIIRADGTSVSEEYESYNNRHIFMNVANADTNAKFKNLTIEAFNVKYCFHFDNPGNHKIIVENCTMRNNNPSVGCGIWSNQKITINDCDITYLRGGETGMWTCGVFAHNWTEQEKECYFYMENVKVKDAQLLHIQCLASGQYDTFKVVNSTSSELGNVITIVEKASGANETINLILEGDKYSIVYDSSFTNYSLHQEGIFDTYIYNNTGSTITQYTALQYDYSDTEQGRKSVKKSDGTSFVGVALNDIAPGSYGYMAYTGRCIKYPDTTTEGTIYTINANGQFEQSNTNVKAVCIKGQNFLGESSQRKMLYLID